MPTTYLISAALVTGCASQPTGEGAVESASLPSGSEACFESLAKALSSDEMEGRGLGTSMPPASSSRATWEHRLRVRALVRVPRREPEQATFTPEFDGFPMFSPDARHLIFVSNRGSTGRQTHLFIARWVD